MLAAAPDAASLGRAYRAIQSIHAAGVHEISRQVGTHCVERAHLLSSLWDASEQLAATMVELSGRRAAALERRLAAVEEEHGKAGERLGRLDMVESLLVSKSDELTRLLQSKEKLVQMVRSLQAALLGCEEQLKAASSARLAAQADLARWLPHCNEYSTRGALEALEAYAAARRDGRIGGGAAKEGGEGEDDDELAARAQRWRRQVRAHAQQLADWEAPPQLPEETALSATEARLLLRDVERLLSGLLCAERPVDEAAELAKREAEWAAEREKLQGDVARAEEARASEGARYQETIARLQQQLSAEQGPRPTTVSFAGALIE